MLDHPGIPRRFPMKEKTRARAPTLPHRTHVATVFGPLPEREVHHPLGCHRPCIPDRAVFEKLIQVLVFGCAYHTIADESCSATTLRDRRDEWIELGVIDELRQAALGAYDRYIGLELSEVAVDCCITKAPCGGEKAGRSLVDRGKLGIKRSTAVDAEGVPIAAITAAANRHDSPLLVPTLEHACASVGGLLEGASVLLDRSYDSDATRERLEERGLISEISQKGKPSPLGATKRWVLERTSACTTPIKSSRGARRGGSGWWTFGWLSPR